MEEIIVKDRLVIDFLWKDQTPGGSNLGRAEFQVCQIWKKGKLKEYFVYPMQQRNQKYYWHYISEYGMTDFIISSYQDLKEPEVWLMSWCQEHKTNSFSLYAPVDSKILILDNYGLNFMKHL